MEQRSPEVRKWHASDDFKSLVMRFYENHARPVDKKEMSEAKQYNDQLMRQLQNNLEAKRIEYQGSSYEGIKTRSSELEFDCMVVLPGGDELEQDATGVQTGFSKLHLEDEYSNLTKFVEGGGYLSPQLVRESFYGSLTKAVDDLPQSETVKIRKHGDAAVQLDIKRPSGPKKGQFWYSVDVVPGYEVGGEAFIPKSSKRKEKTKKKKKTVVTTENGDTNGASTTVKKKKAKKPKTTTEAATAGVPKKKKKSPKKLTWRRSFAAEEKECMSDLDVGNQCHKMCARTLKVIVNIDPPLRALQSYAIKTTQLTQNVRRTFVFGSLMVRFQRTVRERSGNVLGTLISHMGLVRFSFYFGSLPTNLLGTFSERWSLIWDLVRFSFYFGSFPTNLLGTFPERWSLIYRTWFVFRSLLVRSQRTFWERSQSVHLSQKK